LRGRTLCNRTVSRIAEYAAAAGCELLREQDLPACFRRGILGGAEGFPSGAQVNREADSQETTTILEISFPANRTVYGFPDRSQSLRKKIVQSLPLRAGLELATGRVSNATRLISIKWMGETLSEVTSHPMIRTQASWMATDRRKPDRAVCCRVSRKFAKQAFPIRIYVCSFARTCVDPACMPHPAIAKHRPRQRAAPRSSPSST